MIEAYVAPREIGGHLLRVLVADASNERVNNFRLKGNGAAGYQLRIARTEGALLSSLNELRGWDVLLHSLFLGDWNLAPEKYTPTVIGAFKAKRLRGVVCTSTIEREAKIFIRELRAAGVPCTYVPFNYAYPHQHLKQTFPELKYS